jgi:hypothetical protein
MATAQHAQNSGKKRSHRGFLYLIIEESHQHAKHVCEAALVAQQEAQEIIRMSQRARQRRQSNQVERALCREYWGGK